MRAEEKALTENTTRLNKTLINSHFRVSRFLVSISAIYVPISSLIFYFATAILPMSCLLHAQSNFRYSC